jgi:signal transduction histidine kinase
MNPEPPLRAESAWRSSATRLIAIYGALFVIWSAVLIAIIHWETQRYLSQVVNQILEQRAHYFTTVERDHLPDALATASAADLQGLMAYGLFAADGHRLSGNIAQPPAALPPDGQVRLLRQGILRQDRAGDFSARAIALPLDNGELLVLARATSIIDQVGVILRQGLLWALSLTLIPGLIGGYVLRRGPLRRVPLSARGDELDLLASIVNTMLTELERLMGEVKGVCDNIAHDLRTPLTRLWTQLHRLRQQVGADSATAVLAEGCIGEVDALLRRFSALLRIAELEDLRRREGFARVDLAATLREVHELYIPLAEDKRVQLHLTLEPLPKVRADRELLFEAISNLVSNAIKFTPPGGNVQLRAGVYGGGARISVHDSGPGIPAAERAAVLERFYRSETTRQLPGSGLGLSIVSAIVRLHGFELDIGTAAEGGACVILDCGPPTLGEER